VKPEPNDRMRDGVDGDVIYAAFAALVHDGPASAARILRAVTQVRPSSYDYGERHGLSRAVRCLSLRVPGNCDSVDPGLLRGWLTVCRSYQFQATFAFRCKCKVSGFRWVYRRSIFQSLCPVTSATCSMEKPASKRRLVPSWRKSWK
jgi:hypothetical protein